jgi:hypothetical protein
VSSRNLLTSATCKHRGDQVTQRGLAMRSLIHLPASDSQLALLLLLLGLLSIVLDINAVAATSYGIFSAKQCARCAGLQYCTAMNGKLLFDPIVGYTRYGARL